MPARVTIGGGKGLMAPPKQAQQQQKKETMVEMAKRKGYHALRWQLEVRGNGG